MTMLAVLPLPGTADPHEGRILWFSADGCVYWSGDGSSAEVFVAGTLIGRFTLRERGARNVLLLGLSNPARRRLDHALRIARKCEGDARRLLSRMRPNDRNHEKVEKDLADAVAQQKERAHVRVHVETGDLRTSLAHDRGLGILAGTSQAQDAAASARTRRDQALHGGICQMV